MNVLNLKKYNITVYAAYKVLDYDAEIIKKKKIIIMKLINMI